MRIYLAFANGILVTTHGTEPSGIRGVTERVHVPGAISIGTSRHATCDLKMPSRFRIVATKMCIVNRVRSRGKKKQKHNYFDLHVRVVLNKRCDRETILLAGIFHSLI